MLVLSDPNEVCVVFPRGLLLVVSARVRWSAQWEWRGARVAAPWMRA